MKKSILVSAVALTLASSPVWAQTIKSVDFRSGKQLDMGSISELVIHFDQSAGGNNWCGLYVRWGDGNERSLRIGDDQFKTSPAIVPHTYTQAGNFRIEVEGRIMVRGLRSAVACDGRPAPVNVVVVDKQALADAAAQAQRQEAERRLRDQQAEAERMKAELTRQQAEQTRLDAERRQREFAEKELELKRRELQMREEMLNREEEIRRRQAAQVAAPAPAPRPAAPATAPAPRPSAPATAPAPRPSAPAAVKPADGF
jgi:hypothetical protein